MAGIFINYRRDDVPGVAGRLFDHLEKTYSRSQLFIDVDAIKPGLDFVDQIDAQIAQCHVVLAIIGSHWVDDKDHAGNRRLDSPNDFVRLELALALKRKIPLIPILVDGAVMPAEQDLPSDLKPLARREAIELRYTRFDSDADAIVQALHDLVPKQRSPRRAIVPGAAAALVLVAAAAFWLWPSPTPRPPAPAPAAAPLVVNTMHGNPVTAVVAPARVAPAPPYLAATPVGIPAAAANLLVAIGDPIDKVKTSYGIKSDPTAQGSSELMLAAPLDGLMFFFSNKEKTLREIRADAPFGASIDGVRIGDTLDGVVTKLGQPMRPPWNFGANKAYIFRVGDHKLRCDFDPAGKVATMFVFG
jgi:hypothetical protein